MREELMVKGDTINKTSSGKLSAAGGIKGQGEGNIPLPRVRAAAGDAGAQHRGGGSAHGALWPKNGPAT